MLFRIGLLRALSSLSLISCTLAYRYFDWRAKLETDLGSLCSCLSISLAIHSATSNSRLSSSTVPMTFDSSSVAFYGLSETMLCYKF